jgi:3-phenylpropionate/trans-cinnamate dioxygenase ferredoxin subunit
MEDFSWVAEASAIAPGSMQLVRAAGKSILLTNVEGKIYALSNFCTHSRCYLHNGKLKGRVVTCPCHFAEFDVTTGAVLAPPAKEPLDVYPVKVEGNDIFVALGAE